jgi:hypothetical protein
MLKDFWEEKTSGIISRTIGVVSSQEQTAMSPMNRKSSFFRFSITGKKTR